MARDAEGRAYAWQFKVMTGSESTSDASRVVSKIYQKLRQLTDSHADVKTFVVDTKASLTDMQGQIKRLQQGFEGKGVQFVIRTPDGNVFTPPGRHLHAEGSTVIASTPVAGWTWGRDGDETGDALVGSLRDSLAALGVLATHRFVVGDVKIRISVTEAGNSNSYLFDGHFLLPGNQGFGPSTAVRLADEVREGLRPGRVGSVDTFVACTGVLITEEGEASQDSLFQLGASAFADFVTVNLTTSSDAWMPCDLKGRPQPGVYKGNARRLAAVLHELAEVLGSETDPDDPTYFGRPTEQGVENLHDTDGQVPDLWRGREIPYRNRVFRFAPPFAEGYRRSVDGEVLYVPVRGAAGQVLGYLWASDAHDAASFEPRDDSEEDGYKAGLVWLDRLRSAHDRGFSPSVALTELSRLPDESGSGRVDTEARPHAVDLMTLREWAAED